MDKRRFPLADAPDEATPEWSETDFKEAQNFKDVFPQFAEAQQRGELTAEPIRRGPGKKAKKEQVTLRLDPDILAHYRDSGKGWQSRMNDALRKAAGLSEVS